jgi:hypothetical protein
MGLLVGFLGNIVFYGKTIGLSFPIFTLALVAALLALSIPARQPLRLRQLWLLAPLAFFAAMVAVRADDVMGLNVLAVLGLGALTLHYLPRERALDEESLGDYARGILAAGVSIAPHTTAEIGGSLAWLRERRLQDRMPLLAVGRGLLLALPIVLVFAWLFSYADSVFASYFTELQHLLRTENLGETLGRGATTLLLGLSATGALAYGLARRSWGPAASTGNIQVIEPGVEPLPQNKQKPAIIQLGAIESSIVLGSVDLLFAAFVLIQFAYFFGGSANIAVGKLTYAEYARSGFFELVAVSLLTLGLILTLNRITIRRDGQQTQVFRALCMVMVALTLVILVAASQRMSLYEEAYGYTHLRVYTHVFMRWLGLLLGVALLSVFRVRRHIFSLGVLVVLMGYLGTLNLLNVDYYIAEHNINRYYDGRELDVFYLATLSLDAIPPIVELYQNEHTGVEIRYQIDQWLAVRLRQLDRLRAGAGSTLFSANLSRDRAWALLDGIRADLPELSR